MEKLGVASSGLFSCLLVLFLSSVSGITDDLQDKQVYIVYMGSLPSRAEYKPMSNHISILQEITGESSVEGRLVRSYNRSFNGFSARLTESERERIAKMEGVVSVFPNEMLQLQTTASWSFMGLKEGNMAKRNPTVESDIVIGVIDTGITPESQSFSGTGFGPPPKTWKGVCAGGQNFTCNNKLIGARDFVQEGVRDSDGHGSHTASTAAGNEVAGISFFGLGNGTVRGGVPGSRIAAYKVCWLLGCPSDAALSAFDEAIADGVDIITISVGGRTTREFEKDVIAIGAFHAMTKGILTVVAAGNGGPTNSTVTAVAPWLFSVAASTTNRGFFTKVVLGNGQILTGKSINSFDMKGNKYPLVYGKSAALSTCDPKTADSPLATVLRTDTIFNQTSPVIGSFSSRGPNSIAVDILKPDITAPGVEILAAYSPDNYPGEPIFHDKRFVNYTVLSGTSMSCPHVAGVAAYVKTFHPEWSPSMIKSAIMTTAWPVNATGSGFTSTEFAYGSGHVDPVAAINPGLVYESDKADHIAFLCGMNYNVTTLKLIAGEAIDCSKESQILPRNLNYPSMSAKLSNNSSFTVTFIRTVTNVGTPNSTYKASVSPGHGSKLSVNVTPSVLSFETVNEKQSFNVTVTGSDLTSEVPSSVNLIWSDGTHNVRSPIVVYTK
ncbi:unnamed protein product [Microthlaspi erraticum]|uniref:Subtilisin-like protease fibronectin type-III domain-containing protein n=1 Tax=Microthlaspi erraticum TaxID=1685480 RepID=A0A6D2JN58_9BRAS|nr:unnamed protein product [Microthlaspi erraticum]